MTFSLNDKCGGRIAKFVPLLHLHIKSRSPYGRSFYKLLPLLVTMVG